MLSAEGHRILHSTRHSSIELGKDVVTTDKDGVPCAYQLKGNPGGRLTLQEFRGIEPQLRQQQTFQSTSQSAEESRIGHFS